MMRAQKNHHNPQKPPATQPWLLLATGWTNGIVGRTGDCCGRIGQPLSLLVVALMLLTTVTPARGLTRIRDIARPLGERNNKLVGMGLVVGLNGTGDGGDSLSTIKPLQVMLQKLGNPAEIEDLKNAKNVAVVAITAELGRNGVRNGDKIDIHVSSLYSASSLAGGTLLLGFLRGMNYQDDRVYAIGQGPVTIPDDNYPTVGIVKNGADIEQEYAHQYVEYTRDGSASFTLVLDDDQAGFQMTKTVAMIINEESALPGVGQESLGDIAGNASRPGSSTAEVLDARNIRVHIPAKQSDSPSLFIARIMNLPVELPDPEASVVINEKTGTIAITGNVEITEAIVHVDGLLIRIVKPEPVPTPEQPIVKDSEWSRFDTETREEFQARNDVKMDQLIEALDQLQVPVQEKINAIYALQRAGALRARIINQ